MGYMNTAVCHVSVDHRFKHTGKRIKSLQIKLIDANLQSFLVHL